MPTTYAHYHFGELCIDVLPKDKRNTIYKYRDLYNLGVHGPDIFFYDLANPDIGKYGNIIHFESGRIFFNNSIEVINKYHDEVDAMLAYILGFLTHFTFDSFAHGYVNTKKEISNVSHNTIEAEYDAYLINKYENGVKKYDRSKTLKPSRFNAKIMSRFFIYDENVLYRTIRMQKLIIKALYSKSTISRNVKKNILTRMNKLDYVDLLIPESESEICKDSNLRLDKLKQKALNAYSIIVKNYLNALDHKEELNQYYDSIFDPQYDPNIPVLNYEEELKYILELTI